MKRIFILIILAALLSIVAISALAYVIWEGNGHDLHWSSTHPLTPFPLRYKINFRGTPDSSGEFAAIQRSFKTWEDVLSAEISFEYDGKTNLEAGYDWNNVLTWVEEQWIETTGAGSSVIALTTVTFSTDSGRISDADIEFNGENYTWSESGQVGNDIIDIENVATHEIGHFFGLYHVDNSSYCKDANGVPIPGCSGAGYTEATMYAFTDPDVGETKKRDLDIDDIEGISYLYPVTVNHFVVELGSGVSTPVTAGTPFDITVTARDSTDNIVTTYTGIIHFESSDTNSTLPSDYTFTGGESGTQSFSNVILSTTGDQTITVTDTTDARISGSLINIPVVTSPSPATVSLEVVEDCLPVDLYTPVTVVARDANGDIDEGYNGTIALTSTDPAATLPSAPYTFIPEDNGVHTFYNEFIFRTVGQISITVDDGTIIDTKTGITLTTDPVASDDTATLAKGGTLSVVAPGVLENDSDTDGDPLTAVLISGPSYAVVPGGFTLYSNGSYTYTHDGSNNLTDSFTYETRDDSCGTARATVTITMFSNAAPSITSTGPFNVDENSAVSAIVDTVTASDPNTGDTLTYSIIGGTGSGLFAIDSISGIITVASATLDHETTPSYTLDVQVTDTGPLTDSALITVNVNDLNEAPSITSAGPFSIDENSAVATTVDTATATDPEGDTLSYSIIGGTGSGLFAIDSITGIITVASATLDFETTPSYTLDVQVADTGPLTDSALITVNVNDLNEAPSITSAGPFSIDENSAATTTVDTATATDPEGDTLTYSIIGGTGSGLFAIDSISGIITVASATLDFETTPSYTLDVQVTDTGPLTDSALITVNINDLNEAPSITSAGPFSIDENSAATTTVDTATATDPEGDTLTYSIIGGTGSGVFAIDSITGVITVASATLDFETTPSYTLDVQVADTGPLTDSALITVDINDLNEAPTITSAGPFSIDENSAATTTVDTATATDPEGDTLTYSIIGGTGSGVFAIDSITGVITVASATLDFETTPSYTLDVQVTDTGPLTDSALITVNVNDLNEAPSITSAGPFSIDENSAATTTVDTATATDPEGDTLTYSIIGGTGSGVFAIDSITGVITVASATLDFETTPSYTLDVQVTDTGPLTDSALITVNVNDLNEAPSITSAGPFSIDENSAATTTVDTATATDPEGDTLSYSIIGGTGSGVFAIDSITGVITVASATLDFETTPSYTLDVQVADTGPLTDSATITVNINDLNEAPSITSAGPFSIDENSAVATTVDTATATDPEGDTLSYSIIGGTGSGVFAIDSITGVITVASATLDFETTPSYTLDVQVADTGPLTDSATITVNINDLNEAPSITSAGPFSIDENSAVATTVDTATATDPEGDTLSYSIIGGTGSGLFAIDSITGIITVASATLDHETTPSYTLDVQVTDTGPLTDSALITVNINDLNEAPSITSAGPFSIDENSAVATTVDTATATDPEGDTLSYSIIGGTGSGLFAIDSVTGVITVASATLDFETTPSYTLDVQVTDTGPLTDSALITVNVNDLNEAPSITSAGPFSIDENSAVATTVDTATATDPEGDTLSYSIIGGTGSGVFAIDSITGVITVASATLDFETTPSYSLTVEALDDGLPAQTGSATITVNINDLNEAPSITSAGPFSIDENSAATTTVDTATATDPEGDTLTYSIIGGTGSGVFAIDSITGVITVASATLDFETTPSYTLDVQVADTGPLTDSALITVDINDLNEAPTITSAGPFSIDENSAATTTVDTATATDPEGDTLTYSIIGGTGSGVFAIDSITGVITVASATLDFETTPSYTLDVQVTDTGPLTDSALITVNVNDLNEAPSITSAGPFSIDENSAATTTVDTATATDPEGDTLSYSIIGGTGSGLFAIDSISGIITVASATLDHETTPSYTLDVQVTDTGPLTDSALITVNVNDLNEAPSITSAGPFSIDENSAATTTVDTATATDPEGDTLTYSIIGGTGSGVFAIDSITGVITVASATLDFETTPSYTLDVQVTDTGPLTDSALITVNVNDLNEAPSITSAGPFSIDENSAATTTVDTATATDPEGDTLTYSIIGGTGSGVFAIDSITGVITVASATLDHETTPSYSLDVQVTDTGPLTDSALITVNVNDLNEAPSITSAGPFSIDENSAATTTVDTATATDPEGDTLTYSIIGGTGSGLFAIDSITGVITVASATLDFETTPSYTLDVQVTDTGPLTDSALITVNVNDLNEAPSITSAGPFSIDENSAATTTVDTATATDPEGDTLTYSIIGGTGSGVFAIDSITGVITVASATLDHETTPSYTLDVQVTDTGPLTDSALITVNVNDLNEAPSITSAGPFSIDENSAATTTVDTATATDPEGDTLTYSIIGGTGSGLFAIDSITGVITVASATLDFETTPSYTLDVQVTDTGPLTDSALITVNVNDLNEAPSITSAGPFSIDENSAATTTVDTATATDPEGDTLTYSIIGGTGSGLFAIDSITGVITVASATLDFETTPSYSLDVQVTDTGPLTDSALITVNINDLNEAPSITSAGPFSIDENSAATTTVDTATATDPEGDTLSYSIIGGTGSGVFAIDSITGVITVASATLDFETTPSYTLDVQVADTGPLTDSALITVNVNDLNEAPSITSAGPFSIDENSAATTTVDTATATDPEGDTLSYSIIGGTGSGLFAIDSITGVITVASATLDFETTPSYTLDVQVTDTGPLTDSATITVNINDLNEAPSITSAGPFSIDENSAATTTVDTATATDPEGDTLSYSIIGGTGSGLFAIDSITGVITVASATLDFETTPSYTLDVQVTDTGPLTDSATITVNVNDLNEAPSITSAGPFSIDENSAVATTVDTATATDPEGDTLSYSIIGGTGSGLFAIDSITGVITVASATLDHETTPSYTLDVQVTDTGPLTDSALITVNVNDLNEAPSITSAGPFSIDENSAATTTVDTATATDPEGDTLSYSIIGGTGSGLFAIDSITGVITVASATLDHETTPSYTLDVQVTDTGPLTDSALITVNVNDLNEAPSITSAGPFSIDENSAVATTVDTATATDPEGDTLSYSIIGGTGSGLFAIDSITGVITVASATLDFETTPSYTLDVQVTDTGPLTDSALITVNVNDLNEAPSITSAGPFSIDENSAVATTVDTATATDPEGDTLTYSIIGGTGSGVFAIDSITGVITVASATLDFETTPSYSLTVEALDDGLPAQTGSATITVNVNDLNEAPSITSAGPFSIDENSAATTTVDTATATDPEGDTLTYSIIGGTGSGVFAIDSITGVITVASATLDFETTPSYTLDVQVTDTGPLTDSALITVNVNDLNEAPSITSAGPFSIDENSAATTTVDTATATDPEGDTLTYSIIGGTGSGLFAIDSITGVITVASATLDFETTPSYTLDVQVTDTGPLTDSALITVNINDLNEAPSITSAGPFSIDENSAATTTVDTATATDPEGDTLTYSIIGGTGSGLFAIDSITGVITVASATLDFETTPSYTLDVQVTDTGPLTDSALITVNINDLNEAPSITSAGPFSIDENSAATTTVDTATATDPEGDTLSYSIIGGTGSGLFAIDSITGVITVASATLDFETTPSYTLDVQVTDTGPLTDSALITVNVNDLNEAPSITSAGPFSIDENSAATTTVDTATATDPEGDTLSYSIIGGTGSGLFAIDSITGVITVASATLDFETTPSYTLDVQVTDTGPLTDSALITVNVNDLNEAPSITSAGPFSIDENSAATTTVDTATATDPEGDTLSYSIIGGTGSGLFAIDSITGVITVASATLDFETTPSYTLDVQVTDTGPLTDSALITVNVNDLNEAPSITSAGPFSIDENSAATTTVDTATATDPEGDTLSYSIIGGTGSGVFAIDSITGVITVASATLDHETTPSYTLDVQVTDTGPLTDSALITVNVNDLNEAPSITSAGPFSIDENSAATTTVDTATATDPEGDTLSYSIIGGTGSGLFAIDSITGVITVASATLDFETTPSYTLDVQVTDTGPLTDSALITVNVNDLNEAPSITSAGPFSIDENSAATTTVDTATATDPEGDTLSYSIIGGTGSGLFAIDSITGVITVASATLDFETTPSYSLDVQVTDTGPLTDSALITVNINDLNEAPSITSAGPFSIDENSAATTTVDTATATDPEGDTLSYSIIGGTGSGLFAIDSITGVITVASATLDFETTPSYSLDVQVTDTGPLTDSALITVNVNDLNEAPSITSAGPFSIDENSAATTTVDTATATDPEGDTLTYSIIGGTGSGLFAIDSITGVITVASATLDFETTPSYTLDVQVTDTGPLTDSALITVNVNDLNEAPSITSAGPFSIDENSAATTTVDTATATDPEGDTLSYSIIGGTGSGLFAIDSITGVITVASATLDHETTPSYTLDVQVTDTGPLTDSALITVNVNDLNEAPSITSAGPFSIDENSAVATTVDTATATDPEGDTLTYSIIGGTGSGLFAIDSITGVITVASATLDFETTPSYTLDVQVTDTGPLTDSALITVNVNDLNEAPSITSAGPFSIDENSAVATTVDTATATDPEGDTLSYSIIGGTGSGLFAIDSITGVITVASATLDFETTPSYSLDVQVTDTGPLTDSALITVNVNDLNEAPSITSAGPFSIDENSAATTTVDTATATDPEGDTLTYSIIGGTGSGVFAIDSITGVITVASATLDHETTPSYTLDVQVTDTGPLTDSALITVNINDLNEAPSITSAGPFSIDENSAATTTVDTATATDPEGDTLTYSIIGGTGSGVFAIDSITGVITVASATLDHETTPSYTLDVQVTDTGPLTDSALITVNVNDLNEAPSITSAGPFSIDENSAATTTVDTATATDPEGDTLTYSIIGGTGSGLFAIDSITGVITVASATLDFETTPSYTLDVQVTDTGPLTDSALITVNVNDLNEAPSITSAGPFSIDENSAATTTVDTATATDPEGDTLTYSIIGGTGSGVFAIDSITGVITVASATLDFETTPSYTLDVQVTDTGPLTDSALITVNVNDLNEAPSITSAGPFSIDENSAVATTVDTATATDPEGDTLSYSIIGGTGSGLFAIDSITGVITVASATLDFETTPSYTLDVQVTDTGPLTDSALITVNVNDLNEAPSITSAGPFSIDENSAVATTVDTATATDPEGDTLSYSIIGGTGSGLFAIDSITGIITVASATLDHETTPSYTLDVQVTDTGPLTDSALITVNINDLNEAPSITSAGPFSIDENSAATTTVDTATATDPEGDTLSYSIIGGTGSGVFAIDSITGVITVASATLDHETTPSYTLDVQVADTGPLTDSALITVNINDLNEAPSITSAGPFSIDENSAATTTVDTATATDPEGDTLTYSIIGGTGSGLFAIDSITGVITVASATLDFETTPSYTLDVQVADTGPLTDSALITVNVNDLNEAPSITSAGPFSIDENSAATTTVDTATATDPEGDTLSYSIIGGTGSGVFAIDSITGVITVASATLDFETTPSYTLDVQVTDTGPLTDSALITVNVNDLNEAPTITSAGPFSIDENSAVATTVDTATATDPEGDTLSYSIIGGTGSGLFAIDSITGVITVASATLDFETTPSYTLDVQVTDTGPLTDSALITVNINDLNEAPSITSAGPFSIDENSAATTTVDTATATDPEGDTLSYSIIGGTGSGVFAIDSITGVITVASATLDFETTPSYTLDVQVADTGPLTDSALITVNINDLNEAPTITSAGPFSIDENSAATTTVDTATATDPEGDTLSYSIIGGTGSGLFAIDSITGVITVASATLDFETTPSYTLDVQVTDTGPLTDSALITVNVNDLNEAPSITSAGPFSIDENSAATTTVDTATATDPEGDTLSYSIIGGTGSGLFAIDSITGVITVASATLDFETTPSYTLDVQVTDTGPLTDSALITVNVNDLNEAPSITSAGPFSIDENSAVATTVDTATATDPEGDTLSYSIIGGTGSGLFAIDSVTGVITVASATLDFETTPSYSLTVEALDDGLPAQTVSATITVNINDLNEAPSITSAGPFSIDENSAATTTVDTATATDPEGDTLSYSIIGGTGSGLFAIDSITGVITVASATLDFETTPSYTLDVQVADTGPLTDSATITVNINDLNEAPSITSAGPFSIDENSAVATTVDTATATDPEGDTLSYSIIGGTGSGLFAIDSITGIITVASATLDHETTPSYTLDVQVTDTGPLTDSATITVNINDLNEAPSITSAGPFSIDENSAVATTVDTATATDPEGDTLSYSIIGGTGSGLFAIDSITGIITVASATLDHETTPSYSLTVEALDDGLPAQTGSATITVDINDVNDPPVANNDIVSVDEDSTDNNHNVLGNDTDVDPGDTKTITALGPTDNGGTVTINGAGPNNILLYSPTPNFVGTETFTYTMQDTAGATDTATVTVTVNNVNDPPVALADSYNLDLGTTLNVAAPGLLTNDSDLESDPLAVNSTAVSGPSNGSLILYIDGSFNYTHDGGATLSDNFIYEVNDGNGGTAQGTVTITLGDNDGDGVADIYDPDDDNDTMSDLWEQANGLDPFSDDSADDPDRDNLTNVQEHNNGINGTDPWETDSDRDGIGDGTEIALGTDPSDPASVPNISLATSRMRVTDVTTTKFSLVWVANQPTTGSFANIYADPNGNQLIRGLTIKDESADHPPALQNGVLKVNISGLMPDTTYYYRIVTISTAGILVEPASSVLPSVRTEFKAILVTNDSLAHSVKQSDGSTPALGALLLAEVAGGNYPVTGWVGVGVPIDPSYALVNLNNIYSAASHMNLELYGGEAITLESIGGSMGFQILATQVPVRTGSGEIQALAASPSVLDATVPTVQSITGAANGAYRQGDQISITMTFSESVTVAGGTLDITLDTGQTLSIGSIASDTASFTYTVQPGDNSADLTVSSLALSAGATLRDSVGNDADLTLPAGNNIHDNNAIVIDTTAPSSSATAPAYANGTVSVNWSGSDTTGSGIASTVLWYRTTSGSWADSGLPAQTGQSGTFSFVPSGGEDTYYFATRSTDNAGNVEAAPSGQGDTHTIVDTTVPTATINYSTTSPTNQDVNATLVPSETVTVTNHSGLDYTFTNNGAFTFDFEDAAGNTGSATATVNNIDKTAPTATFSYSTTAPTNQDVTATLVTSETVTVTNHSGLDYTFTNNGAFTFDFEDAARNTGSATATVTNIDKIAPTATIISPQDGDYLYPAQQLVRWTVDELVSSTLKHNGSSKTLGAGVTEDTIVLVPGPNTIEVSALDQAGNTGSATIQVTLDGDNDGDGVSDYLDSDDDNDLMPDTWETAKGLDPFDPLDARLDADGDGHANLTEYTAGTDPQNQSDYPIVTLGVDHITVTDVTTDGFSVIWQATEPSTCGLEVYDDTGALLFNLTMDSESALHAPAEDNGVMKVRVSGLQANTTYQFQTVTISKTNSVAIFTPSYPQLLQVTTESANATVANDSVKQQIYDEGGNDADGTLLVVSVQGGEYPITAWAGDAVSSPWAQVDLNLIYSQLTHENLQLLGGEELTLWAFGGLLGNYVNVQKCPSPSPTPSVQVALPDASHLSTASGYHLDLNIDLNIIGMPVNPKTAFTSYSLLLYLKQQAGGDPTVVESIRRYNAQTGTWETASWFLGVPAGVDYTIKPGEAYLIYMGQGMNGVWFEGIARGAAVDLSIGLNLLSLPAAKAGFDYTSYEMLQDLGDENQVSSIKKYDSTQGWETTSWFLGSASGELYSTSRDEGYLIYMQEKKVEWRAY